MVQANAPAPHTSAPMTVSPPATVSALAGMHDASNRLDVAAHNVANANTTPFAPLRPDGTTDAGDTVDLPTEMVAVATAPIVYAWNAQVVRAADTMQGSLLDLFA
jgi:flagellar basal body rod protein FlgG